MFKKRQSQSHVSPLPSPAATLPSPGSQYQQGPPTFQRPQQHQQQEGGRMPMPPQPYRQSSASSIPPSAYGQNGSMRSRQSMQPGGSEEELQAGPQYGAGQGNGNGYAGPPVERVTSSKGSEKEGKRKSGLFGFGRKKEDKKEKEQELKSNAVRPSFNVQRTESFTPSPPGGYPQQGRVTSNPMPRQNGGDFGPAAGNMPKSQSMGFSHQQQQRGAPEPNAYRGNLAGYPEEQAQPDYGQGRPQGLPKSSSMPLDKATPPLPPSNHSPLPGSPSMVAQGQPHRGSPLTGEQDRPVRDRTVSAGSGRGVPPGGQPEWMKEFAPVVELIGMQPQKTYVASPPELEMILARTSAGGQPKQGQPGSASNDWDAVWLQLSGISLSMWSMKETRAAAAKGDKVPPTYFNVTDSSLELLAPLPPPPHRPNSHPHHHVFSLNTAGSNRLLFSCPTEGDIARWTTGLRLAAWERARLEEIYTGHLIKSGGKEPRMDLQKGRMDGWVRVRIMGGTEWKRLWAVLSTPTPPPEPEEDKKAKRKSFFGLGGGGGSSKEEEAVIQEPNTGQPMASFYPEPRTAKNRAMAPVLTVSNVTQAYAVFPERLEVMSQSNLMKVVGRIGGELVAIEGRLRESGWALIMPDSAESGTASPPVTAQTPLANMMKWVTGVHDVFGLYGRPGRYSWDEKDPKSLFFAYPRGPERNRLFLDIDFALDTDYRLSNLPQIRSQFTSILSKKGLPRSQSQTQLRPRTGRPEDVYADDSDATPPARQNSGDFRLPPLSFDQHNGNGSPHLSDHSIPRSLSPITERTDPSRNNSQRTTDTDRQFSGSSSARQASGSSARQASGSSKLLPAQEEREGLETITDAESSGRRTGEPRYASPVPEAAPVPAATGPVAGGPTHVASPQGMSAISQNTFDSHATGESIYSQSTGVTPTPARSVPVSPSLPKAALPVPTGTATSVAVPPPVLDRDTAGPALEANSAPVEKRPASPPLAPPIGMVLPLQTTAGSAAGSDNGDRSIHSPTPRRVASTEFKQDKLVTHQEQPAAQYLMNVVEEPVSTSPPGRNTPLPSSEGREKVRPTIITDFSPPRPAAVAGSGLAPGAAGAVTKNHEPLGRKPSGARAPPPKKLSGRSSTLGSVDDVESPPVPPVPATATSSGGHSHERTGTFDDIGEDASAYLAYADQPPSAAPQPQVPAQNTTQPEEPHRSSFAPSKAAADRRAKAEAAAVESQQARNLPGGGKRGAPGQGGKTWSDDDEDEDEDEVDEPEESPVKEMGGRGQQSTGEMGMSQRGSIYGLDQQSGAYPSNTGSIGRNGLRALPPVPRPQDHRSSQPQQGGSYMSNGNGNGGNDFAHPSFPERPRSRSPAPNQYPQQPQQPRGVSQRYDSTTPPPGIPNVAPPASRQTIWNANFAAGHGMHSERSTNKFVEVEEPQARLTQAFAPHGLLQAGMQDKEDRSAKKQEELAREMGSSLVNVPSKPPPPSAGLLGAVAQHEKERRNAGGIGATLTDREREKRLAEDRQREIEKLQRQQAEHMRQFQDFGQGGQQGYGGYGMGMPQMGMGMGMPPMGFNPYQGGFNPYAQQQAMYAAQMAYQNAMMMSAAGSQAGGAQSPDRPASPVGGGGSQYGGHGPGSPFPQMPYGWGGMPGMPWMSPQPTGSPHMMGGGMGGMGGMSSFPSMGSFAGGGGGGGGENYLHPGQGYGQGGNGQSTPREDRSSRESFRGDMNGRDRSEDRRGGGGGGTPAN